MATFTDKEAEALAIFVDADVMEFVEVASGVGMTGLEVQDLLVKLLKCLKDENA